jgi:hypothetical protein
MKRVMTGLLLLLFAGSAAPAQDYYDLSRRTVIRPKSISAYNAVPDASSDPRRNRPGTVKPYTRGEKSLFQRLLRWE